MSNDLSTEYAERSSEELLQLASERASLTDEARIVLDAEFGRRTLTKSDQIRHEQFVKRSEQREAKRRRRKVFGSRHDRVSWVDNFVVYFWSAVVMALIALAYQALPSRFHFTPDWQEAAVIVMFASIFIAVASNWWRDISFWISLVISSTIHSVLTHAWIVRTGSLSRGEEKLAVLLGLLLFAFVYGCGWLLRQKCYGEEVAEQ